MSIFDKPSQQPSQQPAQQQPAQQQPVFQTGDPNMSIFERIGTAEVSIRGIYPMPGVYPVLYIDTVTIFRSRKGYDLFTVSFLILESQVADRPAGTKMSWQANLQNDAGPGNARAFLASNLDSPIQEVTPEVVTLACSSENPCHGRLVRLSATGTKTKADKDFTICEWTALAPEFQAQAEAARKAVFPE